MKRIATLLAVAAMLMMVSMPASADTILVGQSATYNYTIGNCGPQNSTNCTGGNGIITATATFTLMTSGSLKITISNTTSNGAGMNLRPSISGIGFDSTPTLTTGAVTQRTGAIVSWAVASGSGNGLGIGGYEVRSGDPGSCNQGPAPGTSSDTICAGETGSITFNIAPTIGAGGLTFDATALHIQSTIGSWKVSGTSVPPPPPPPAVPEPASLALLGTGLISAGSFVRRKLMA